MANFEVKTVTEIVNDALLDILEGTTDVNDANVGSVLRNFVESFGNAIGEVYDALQLIYAGTRISTATDTDLEQLGLLVGIERLTGTQSTGIVTMRRNSVASADFSIAADAIVATQPSGGDAQLRFTVDGDTTFSATITNESQTYTDGIASYRLAERFVGNTTAVTISATVGGTSGTALTNITDFNIKSFNDFIEATSGILTLDDAESADWTESTDATADVTSAINIQGNWSLAFGKSGTASNTASYSKVLGAVVNGTGKNIVAGLRIVNETTLNKINRIDLVVGSGGSASNAYTFSLDADDIATTAKFLRYSFNPSSASAEQTGNPSITNTNFLRWDIITNNATDTLSSGDILYDYLHFVTTKDYIGDVVEFDPDATVPDTDTNFLVTYQPLSKEVDCTANAVGDEYNVTKNKITFKISSIPNITTINNYEVFSGGSDLESDDDLRTRILGAAALQGKATKEALRQAVLGVDGVASVTVDDLPRRSVTSEVHVFSTGTARYDLDNEVLFLDDTDNPTNISVTGTVSASSGHSFLYGTDYVQVLDDNGAVESSLEWVTGGTAPDDSTNFFADYDYDWLGHVDIFVSGVETPLPSTILDNVNTAVTDTRAAGITINVTEPTIVTIDVTAAISIDSGFTFADVQSDVEDALFDYLNTLDVGVDVFRAELFRVIQDVAGVDNSTITTPASDTVIATDEVGKPGTITVSAI